MDNRLSADRKRKRSCIQCCNTFLWRNKEHLYNKVTVPAPCCAKCKNKCCLVAIRVIILMALLSFFWVGCATLRIEYPESFTAWSTLLSVVTFTLLLVAHLKEYCAFRRRDILGVDSVTGDDTTANGISALIMFNPYSPSHSQVDFEQFRLQSKNATLWKLAIITYEMAVPV